MLSITEFYCVNSITRHFYCETSTMARLALGCLLAVSSASGFTLARTNPAASHRGSQLHSSKSSLLDFGNDWEKEFGGGSSKEPQLLDSEEGTPFPSMPLPEEVRVC